MAILMRERIGVAILVAQELLKRAVPVGIALIYLLVICAVVFAGFSLLSE
jgi:hypothetical protein